MTTVALCTISNVPLENAQEVVVFQEKAGLGRICELATFRDRCVFNAERGTYDNGYFQRHGQAEDDMSHVVSDILVKASVYDAIVESNRISDEELSQLYVSLRFAFRHAVDADYNQHGELSRNILKDAGYKPDMTLEDAIHYVETAPVTESMILSRMYEVYFDSLVQTPSRDTWLTVFNFDRDAAERLKKMYRQSIEMTEEEFVSKVRPLADEMSFISTCDKCMISLTPNVYVVEEDIETLMNVERIKAQAIQEYARDAELDITFGAGPAL